MIFTHRRPRPGPKFSILWRFVIHTRPRPGPIKMWEGCFTQIHLPIRDPVRGRSYDLFGDVLSIRDPVRGRQKCGVGVLPKYFYPYMTPSGAKTIYEYVILPIHDPLRGQNFHLFDDSTHTRPRPGPTKMWGGCFTQIHLRIHDPIRGQSYTLLNQKFV